MVHKASARSAVVGPQLRQAKPASRSICLRGGMSLLLLTTRLPVLQRDQVLNKTPKLVTLSQAY